MVQHMIMQVIGRGMISKLGGLSHCEHVLPTVMPIMLTIHKVKIHACGTIYSLQLAEFQLM